MKGSAPYPARQQIAIASCFLISLVAVLVLLGWLQFAGGLFPEDTVALFTSVLGLYSAPLGVVVGGMFARRKTPPTESARGVFAVAIGLILLWNALILWRTVAFVFAADAQPASFAEELKQLANASLFLFSALLAYYFAK